MAKSRNVPDVFKENGIDIKYDDAFRTICEKIFIDLNTDRFVYFIDENYVMDTSKGWRWENLTPEYNKILELGLNQMKYESIETDFHRSYNNVLECLKKLSNRIIDELKSQGNADLRISWFERIQTGPAKHFDEAIQRLLFVNQIFWQTDHRLVGLGAWDSILWKYYKADIEAGLLTKDGAKELLCRIFRILHEHYEYKSNVLMGDTGQIFVLGKSDEAGNYLCNDLTYLFIEAAKEVNQPEPKCLLRVNKNTPRDLMKLSVETMATGIGSPLIANDDQIVKELIAFGIEKDDAYDYTTSACWEPLIGGKSVSPNNITPLNFLKGLDNLLKRERFEKLKSFDDFFNMYLRYLKRNIKAVKRVSDMPRFQYNPLLSVFIDGPFEKEKDVSQGGAKYFNTGITTVGLGNLINSLMIVKKFVYEEKTLSLNELKQAVCLNFVGFDDLKKKLSEERDNYGGDNPYVVDMVNKITACVSEEISDFHNYLGGKMKMGISGSAYMDAARNFGASIDGRCAGEPFRVHISNENNDAYTVIINFASSLEYGNARFNGNVIDLMASPSFVEENIEPLVDILQVGIEEGIFELQMNVISSDILIAARDNPELFPNLIVRVWGFSSYFKDLPVEYKELLITRALNNEKNIM